MSADIHEMVKQLWLTDEIWWDLALYWIFLLNVGLLLMSGSSALSTLLIVTVIISTVIDKTHAFGYMIKSSYDPIQFHEEIFIGTYLIRVAMFAAPLSIAGMTKNPKARGLGILAGISGGVYAFWRWYVEQSKVSTKDIGLGAYWNADIMLQSVGMVIVFARIALRRKLLVGTIHRDIPVTVPRDFAAHDVEVELA
jgi:hypothetical protein